jgi:excinuclease UvrABC nuclease subunit
LSQDPIRLEGGSRFYGYVKDTNYWIDPLGLECRKAQLRKIGIPEAPGVYHIEFNGKMYTGSADNLLDRLSSGTKKHKKATQMLFDKNGNIRPDVKITIKQVDTGDVSKVPNISSRRATNHILRSFEQEMMDGKHNFPKSSNSENAIRAVQEARVNEFLNERTISGAHWL